MSHRVKEEERIERIIRGLLKLPENRRCINCNSLDPSMGPQYVCTTFWTFVCTNCSGVHREFTHRVKSVSMAKFNAEEVSALQAGGNEVLMHTHSNFHSELDSFTSKHGIHNVILFQMAGTDSKEDLYERRSFEKPTHVAKEDFYERHSFERSSHGGKDDFYERRSFERSSPSARNDERSSRYVIDDRRSPRYKQENVRSASKRNRPARFEIVDDRFRDDGFGSIRRSENHRFSKAESRAGSRSPDPQKIREMISPPVVRPVKDILGENVPALKVGKLSKANDRKDENDSAHAQKTVSSGSPAPVDVKAAEPKTVTSSSLIDFDNGPELPDSGPVPQTQTLAPSSGGDGPSVQPSALEKASTAPNVNSVESLLFELSGPAVVPASSMPEVPNNSNTPSAIPGPVSNGVAAIATAPTTNTRAVPNNAEASVTSPAGNSQALPNTNGNDMLSGNDTQQLLTSQQHQPSAFNAGDSISTAAQQSSSSVASSYNQDLFTLSYSSYPAPVPSWQYHPSPGTAFGMQYHPNAVPVPAFPTPAKSTNPFDLGEDNTQVQAPMFPSMSALQGALPQVSAHTGLQPQPSPYASPIPQQSPSYGMTGSPGAYMGQQLPNSMPLSRPQGVSSFGSGEAAFASLNPLQQPSVRYPAPSVPNSFSSTEGNPFG
ncbi:hypothetical protein RJ640_022596 [Escallonia rubra]|uniref:Arf-GAP domain-containing protein n=1 Tax=Escallonia rubra TaxID=112253 RepID=A0AA88RD78_9ASTE|nr:hypothetical protein RJ640_022596 [Escallonia rubra]